MTPESRTGVRPAVSTALLLGTLVGFQLWFAWIVTTRLELSLTDATAILILGGKLLVDLALLAAGTELLSRWTRTVWAPCCYSFAYLTIILANSLVYLYGNTLFELGHLMLVTPSSLASYAEPVGIGALLLVCAAFFVCLDHARSMRHRHLRLRAQLIWLVLAAVGAASSLAGKSLAGNGLHAADGARGAHLSHAGQTIVTQVGQGISDQLASLISHPASADRRRSDSTSNTPSWVDFRTVLNRYDLPMGPRHLPQLASKTYSRVVFVFVESLSLDLLHCENPRIDLETTPFLCSDEISRVLFRNLWTSASPTMKGLSAVFTSHPNSAFQTRAGYPRSLPKALANIGYTCVFMRSASRNYGGSQPRLHEMGFDEIIGSEDVADDLKPHVYGWGLEDRMLYEQLVRFLDARRKEKLFVAVLGTDTHPLTGREHRSPDSYPTTPTDLEGRFGNAAKLMQSVFRADHDLARLVDMMEARDLLGPDTLLLITADHSCSPNPVTRSVPGHSRSPLGRIPLVILSGGKLPLVQRDVISSQLDIAPTILHLLDLPIPQTWWGESLFAPHKTNPAIGYDGQSLIIRGPERVLVVPINRQGRAEHGDLINLFLGRAELP